LVSGLLFLLMNNFIKILIIPLIPLVTIGFSFNAIS